MIVRTLTCINVFPLWSHDASTVTPNRKLKFSERSSRFWMSTIKFSEFLRLRNLGILQIKCFLIIYFWGKGLNNSLWVEWYRNIPWAASPQKHRWTSCETVICGLGYLSRMRDRRRNHMWIWKREFSQNGRGRMRSRRLKQLCFWRSLFWIVLSFWSWRTLTRGFQDEQCLLQGE